MNRLFGLTALAALMIILAGCVTPAAISGGLIFAGSAVDAVHAAATKAKAVKESLQ